MDDAGTRTPTPGHPTTGSPEVDAALDRLAELDTLPVAAHAEVFEDVHTRLRSALADLAS